MVEDACEAFRHVRTKELVPVSTSVECLPEIVRHGITEAEADGTTLAIRMEDREILLFFVVEGVWSTAIWSPDGLLDRCPGDSLEAITKCDTFDILVRREGRTVRTVTVDPQEVESVFLMPEDATALDPDRDVTMLYAKRYGWSLPCPKGVLR